MTSAHAGRAGRAWLAARSVALERDGYRCQLRLPGCKLVANTADHIRTRHECVTEGTHGTAMCTCDTVSNLRAACLSCNVARGNEDRLTRRRPNPTSRKW